MLKAVKPRLFLGSAALALLAVSMACGSTAQRGGLVIGLETDVSVPANVDGIGISVAVDGQIKYSRLFALDAAALPGKRVVRLPATIVVLEPAAGDAPSVDIRAVAFHQGHARIVRDVISTVPHGRTALLRLPLAYLGYNDGVKGSVPVSAFEAVKPKRIVAVIHPEDTSDAGLDADLITNIDSRCTALQHLTNVDGECVDAHIDSDTLPDYEDAELFENGKDESGESNPEQCFDMETCFDPAASHRVALDRTNGECTVKLEGSPADLNVALAIQQSADESTPGIGFCVGTDATGSRRCMVPIDRDDQHGFRVDTARGVVVLPQGVCDRRTVVGIELAHGCASKTAVMPIDGAGANCIDNGASDGGVTEAGKDAGGADANALPQVAPWYRQPGATGVAALDGGDVAVITKSRVLTYVVDVNGTGEARSTINDASPKTTQTGIAFVAVDPGVSVVYATFNDEHIAHVLFTQGMHQFDATATDYITDPGPDPGERIGLGVAQCNATVCFPSSPSIRTMSFPALAASGATTATTFPVRPYLGAFGFGVSADETLFGSYAAVVDGGAATAVAVGTPSTLVELRLTGATRAFGIAASEVATQYRVVVTEAQQDGRVHVVVVDGAVVGGKNAMDVGTIGSATDAAFLMRNLVVDDKTHYVYLTDSTGNLLYIDPFAATPMLRNVDAQNRVCTASLGVAKDTIYVYRACATGVTRDNLVK